MSVGKRAEVSLVVKRWTFLGYFMASLLSVIVRILAVALCESTLVAKWNFKSAFDCVLVFISVYFKSISMISGVSIFFKRLPPLTFNCASIAASI